MLSLADEVRQNPNVVKLRRVNPSLAEKIVQQGGCVTADDIPGIVAIDRMMMLLVRCNEGRFLTPAQNVKHFVTIITEHGRDWVRDVSVPVN